MHRKACYGRRKASKPSTFNRAKVGQDFRLLGKYYMYEAVEAHNARFRWMELSAGQLDEYRRAAEQLSQSPPPVDTELQRKMDAWARSSSLNIISN
eukprot:SAG22_NODE_269_length_13236_cov_124.463424_12_plen_96_part_00